EVTADTYHEARAESLALAGGIVSGSGNVSSVEIDPTVSVEVRGSTITAENVTIRSVATVSAEAETFGVSAGGLSVAVSIAEALVSPTVSASIGGVGVTVTAGSVYVIAGQTFPDGGHAAASHATGSSGAIVSANATESTASNTGSVS